MISLESAIASLQSSFPAGSTIVVAMSGGVDSSFTAALVKRANFNVIGITLQLYDSPKIPGSKTCCSGADIQDAKKVAESENFPHYVLDYRRSFQEKVIDDFVDTYERGKTPIPCGRCNQFIKFGDLLEFVDSIGAQYLLTGHYVKREDLLEGPAMFRGLDIKKDQSYFLALTTQKQLARLFFPLSTFEKSEVKRLAASIGLITAEKPESQDICFIPDGDYKSFLFKIRPEMFRPGDIISKNGILGRHRGLAGYTIGQRRGLELNDGPWYVTRLDVANNILEVGRIEELSNPGFVVSELNLLVDEEYFCNQNIEIQIRARHQASPGIFDPKKGVVKFLEPQDAITPGQICAFYDSSRVLGGGIISEIIE